MRYFMEMEFWNYKTMNKAFLAKLDEFRHQLKAPIFVTSSNNPAGHVPNSDHYRGMAIDFTTTAEPEDVIKLVQAMKFGGFGVYKAPVGIYYHIADGGRDKGDKWVGISTSKGIVYKSWNEENLKAVMA